MTHSNSEIFDFSPFKKLNGVTYLSDVKEDFEKTYIDIRNKESRVLNDNEVKILPKTDSNYNHHVEWNLRKQTCDRFLSYIENNKFHSILDIGCGNGWFTNLLAQSNLDSRVIGIDINKKELEQASRVFNSINLEFVYLDLFEDFSLFDSKFDLITLNASVQYFPDIKRLIKRLKEFLMPNGEIHILDSPFYSKKEISNAKERTREYFHSLGNENLSNYYFHHSYDSVTEFEVLYKPNKGVKKRILNPKGSPFFWLKFTMSSQIDSIKTGFSKIAKQYENLEINSSLIQYKREKVRGHLLSRLKEDCNILEINCGTGLDAVFFAKLGYKVLATDVAEGMLKKVEDKISGNRLHEKLSCKKLSFDELNGFNENQFSCLFSNFGGLNCTDSLALKQVIEDASIIIKPEGVINLVIMPKITFYEWFRILKGNKSAFRRLKKGGVLANVNDEKVKTYYHSSNEVRKMLSKKFIDIQIENIFTFGPGGNLYDFPIKRPFVFKIFKKIDKFCSKTGLFRGFGDYYIISAKRKKED